MNVVDVAWCNIKFSADEAFRSARPEAIIKRAKSVTIALACLSKPLVYDAPKVVYSNIWKAVGKHNIYLYFSIKMEYTMVTKFESCLPLPSLLS